MSARSNLGISRFFSRKLFRQRQANHPAVDAKHAKQRRTRSMLVETLEDRRVMAAEWCPDFNGPIGGHDDGCPATGLFTADGNRTVSSMPSNRTTNPINAFSGVPIIKSVDIASQGFGDLQAHARSFSGLNDMGSNGNGWVISNQPFLAVRAVNVDTPPAAPPQLHDPKQLVAFVESGSGSMLFSVTDAGGGPWKSHQYHGASLTYNSLLHEWTLTDPNGNLLVFHDLPRFPSGGFYGGRLNPEPPNQNLLGKLKRVVLSNGTIASYTYDSNAQLQSIRREDSTLNLAEQFDYSYSIVSNNLGNNIVGSVNVLSSVILKRGTISEPSSLQAVRSVAYQYYTGEGNGLDNNNDGIIDDDAAHGRLGDLKLVSIHDGDLGAVVIDEEYYRYYKMNGISFTNDLGPLNAGGIDVTYPPSNGNFGGSYSQGADNAIWSGLKMVVKGSSFARLRANVPNFETRPDSDLKPYADNFYRYERWADYQWDWNTNASIAFMSGHHFYTRYRVVEETSQGSGCTACSDGMGEFGFEIHVSQGTRGNDNSVYDPNVWRVRTTEYLPNASNLDFNADGLVDDEQWADNDRYLIYMNEVGQVLFKVLVQVDQQVRSIVGISSTLISTQTGDWTLVTINSDAHGLSNGDRVAINGAKTVISLGAHKRPAYNGVHQVTVINPNQFTIKLSKNTPTASEIDSNTVKWTKVKDWSAHYYQYSGLYTSLLENNGVVYENWEFDTPEEDFGQLVLHAHPSAIIGWDESFNGLVTRFLAPEYNYDYLLDDSGLIELYDYHQQLDTATETTSGVAYGYHWKTKVKHGEREGAVNNYYIFDGGTVVEEKEYKKREAGGATVYPIGKHTRFADVAGNQPQITTYDYTWHTGTTQTASTTVNQPIVSAAQNGSDAAESSTTVFDIYGRPTWTKDADGFIHYTQYDTATGAVIKTINDVNTTNVYVYTSTYSGLPSDWLMPAGGGKHIKTEMEVDGLGRTTKLTDPNGNVTYTVYNDANREVRVYPGWNATTGTTTGPIQVRRQYWPTAPGGISFSTDPATPYELVVTGQVVYNESLTSSATPTREGTAGSYKPNGEETFDDSNLQSLTRELTNNAGQVLMRLQFFLL